MAGNNAIQFLRGNSIKREASTEVALAGQPVFETDTNKLYIGDGVTEIKDLTAIGADAVVVDDIQQLIQGNKGFGITSDYATLYRDGITRTINNTDVVKFLFPTSSGRLALLSDIVNPIKTYNIKVNSSGWEGIGNIQILSVNQDQTLSISYLSTFNTEMKYTSYGPLAITCTFSNISKVTEVSVTTTSTTPNRCVIINGTPINNVKGSSVTVTPHSNLSSSVYYYTTILLDMVGAPDTDLPLITLSNIE